MTRKMKFDLYYKQQTTLTDKNLIAVAASKIDCVFLSETVYRSIEVRIHSVDRLQPCGQLCVQIYQPVCEPWAVCLSKFSQSISRQTLV